MLGEARISLAAISANAALLAARDRDFVADVSFDGYGHGALQAAVAARQGGALRFGVSSDREALELRDAGLLTGIIRDAPSSAIDLYGLGDDPAYGAVMSVVAPVVGIKVVGPGDGVSYGYTFRASSHSTLALVGIGYADGLDRVASNRGSVSLGERSRPIVGRVAMNVMMVDLGNDASFPGDEAVVFGGSRRAIEWASQIGRRASEVAIEFGSKLQRVWA